MADNPQDPNNDKRRSPILYLSLTAVLFGIFLGTFWIKKGLAENPFEQPPSPAFFGVLLAAVSLVIGIFAVKKQGEPTEAVDVQKIRWQDTALYP